MKLEKKTQNDFAADYNVEFSILIICKRYEKIIQIMSCEEFENNQQNDHRS